MSVLLRRLAVGAALPTLLAGIALARGRKAPEPPPPPPPEPAPVQAEAPPPPPPQAPPLFPNGLPVVVDTLPAGLASLSAQGCNACHWAAHDGWEAGGHNHGLRSATFRAAVRAAGDSTACQQCHLPLAAQHAELAAGYVDDDPTRPRLQENPSFDPTLRGEGVTCAACHVRGDTIVASEAAPDAPHPVAVSAELADGHTVCATCHELSWPGGDRPFYATHSEWEGSVYAKAGVSCVDCHMAPMGARALGAEGGIAGHGVPADVSRALSALIDLQPAVPQRGQPVAVTLVLQNTGAGHHVPTGNPFTPLRVDVAFVDAVGKDLAGVWSNTLARTVEPAPPWRTLTDTRLAAGASARFEHQFTPNVKGASGWGAIEVRAVRDGVTTVLSRVPVEVR